MGGNKSTSQNYRTVLQGISLVVVLWGLMYSIIGPFGMERGPLSLLDMLFFLYLGMHFLWVLLQLGPKIPGISMKALFRWPEVFFLFGIILFIFSYTYASNANMDYVQRFAESSGNLTLAPDSQTERLNSILRFMPFLLLDVGAVIVWRMYRPKTAKKVIGYPSAEAVWALFYMLLSAAAYAFAFPSFLYLPGIAPLAYVALIPLILVLRSSSYGWSVLYGTGFGIIQTMLTNYWLGTFSLISLQFITIYYGFIYFLFMLILVWLLKKSGKFHFLIFALAWTTFDYLRTNGFMGYPWGMIGVTQYNFLPFIQLSSITGIWGVSFILYLINGALSEPILLLRRGFPPGKVLLTTRKTLFGIGILFAGIIVFGGIRIAVLERGEEKNGNWVTAALIQQNTDPRKHEYKTSLDVLTKLTDEALKHTPDTDIVAWSETAFVPNIRRWGAMKPEEHEYARLVHQLRTYQQALETWLVTGNDDYTLTLDEDGEELRLEYNAAILFSDKGTREETYHKIHLVPFTEYFPFKEQLPWLYQMLLDFDVYLWEPGTERTVFKHPKFTFSTPICFEDAFPNDVRLFVQNGADVILNLSNDFWSLTNVEAKQHYINSLFRAVENRRTLLRATASGLTAWVTPEGRLMEKLPYYEEAWMIARFFVPEEMPETIYTALGDWFPIFCLLLLCFIFIFVRYTAKRELST